MINHVWTVLCTKSIIDNESNNVSLIDVAEVVNLTNPPPETDQNVAVPIGIEIVTLWEKYPYNEPATATARMRIQFPDGSFSENTNRYSIDLTLSQYKRNRMKTSVNAFPYRGPGRYVIIVELGTDIDSDQWTEVAKVPLEINVGNPGEGTE